MGIHSQQKTQGRLPRWGRERSPCRTGSNPRRQMCPGCIHLAKLKQAGLLAPCKGPPAPQHVGGGHKVESHAALGVAQACAPCEGVAGTQEGVKNRHTREGMVGSNSWVGRKLTLRHPHVRSRHRYLKRKLPQCLASPCLGHHCRGSSHHHDHEVLQPSVGHPSSFFAWVWCRKLQIVEQQPSAPRGLWTTSQRDGRPSWPTPSPGQ